MVFQDMANFWTRNEYGQMASFAVKCMAPIQPHLFTFESVFTRIEPVAIIIDDQQLLKQPQDRQHIHSAIMPFHVNFG